MEYIHLFIIGKMKNKKRTQSICPFDKKNTENIKNMKIKLNIKVNDNIIKTGRLIK